MQVTWEFDLDLFRVDRKVYSILDLIGDIGGFYDGLVILFTLILAAIHFNSLDHYMIEHLFVKEEESATRKTGSNST